MEHPDLSPDAAAGQDVGVVIPELECGPGQGVEIFFDVFVFVFHQHGAAVHVDDADGVAATSGHQTSGLRSVCRVRLKHNLMVTSNRDVAMMKGIKHKNCLTSQIWVWMSAGSLFLEWERMKWTGS